MITPIGPESSFTKTRSPMISIQDSAEISLRELGIYIKPAQPYKQKWELINILIQAQPGQNLAGTVTFFAHDEKGFPVKDLLFIVGWDGGYSLICPDYKGRSSLKLEHVYDPNHGSGPYWGGPFIKGIAPTVHGFGIPKGYVCDFKFIYERI